MRHERRFCILYINGYGIPASLTDQNYRRYLSRPIREHVLNRGLSELPLLCVLAGGRTDPDRPTYSEACYMLDWFRRYHEPFLDRFEFRLLEEGRDLEANLLQLRELCTELQYPIVTLYCEWARQDWFRFLVTRYIPNGIVVPIVFDRGEEPRWSIRLQQLLLLPWRVLRYRFGSARAHQTNNTLPRTSP